MMSNMVHKRQYTWYLEQDSCVKALKKSRLIIGLLLFFFFFSSRRRHTRCLSDWSSDVWSSDLEARLGRKRQLLAIGVLLALAADCEGGIDRAADADIGAHGEGQEIEPVAHIAQEDEIGRASCRERV